MNEKSTIFEQLYFIYILKNLTFAKKSSKILESIDNINNVLYSIEYQQLFSENNNKDDNEFPQDIKKIDEIINSPKYENRDKFIKDMTYKNFYTNCKTNNYIEKIFTPLNNNDTINEEIIIRAAPTYFLLYKYNFGYQIPENNEEFSKLKKLVFNGILNKLKESERENINTFKQIFKTILNFCEILTDEDKYTVYAEIKTIFYNSFFNQNITLEIIFYFIVKFSALAVKKTNVYKHEDKDKDKDKNINKENNNLIKENKDNNITEPVEDINSIDNVNFDEKKYFGLELVYKFISNEQYEQIKMSDKQQKDYKAAALDGIIEILSSIKSPKNAINIILNLIYNAIKNKKDVMENLSLLQKLLGYSKIDDFSSEFGICLKEYLGKVDLIEFLISET
jgi:hypothetical protein